MPKPLLVLFLLAGLISISCKELASKQNSTSERTETSSTDSTTVYTSENLIIRKLSNHIYEHVSYLNTDDYGKVGCNGMLVINESEGIVFDTPTDDKGSLELINFINTKLEAEIVAVIPTHFHADCAGGILEFEKNNVPTYAFEQTTQLMEKNGQKFTKSVTSFTDSLTLDIGNKKVYVKYFGEGHTKDNVIGYFTEDNAFFGGCLIKKVGASKGYLGDANTNEWSETVRKIKLEYPNAKIVIPGHGESGGTELFDYTIELFQLN